MSVARHLGLQDPQEGLLAQARDRWPIWQESHPDLRVVPDLLDVPAWTTGAGPGGADEVLWRLAWLANPRGGDDAIAAGALSWLLLPGACTLAHRLRLLSARIDEIVAAQLWLEARSFPFERPWRVAAGLLAATRRGVLRDVGVVARDSGPDRAWAYTRVLDPSDEQWPALESTCQQPSSGTVQGRTDELTDLLSAALATGAIDHADQDLLIEVALTAHQVGARRDLGAGGLCSRAGLRQVGERRGVSPATIQRKVRASLNALRLAQQISA